MEFKTCKFTIGQLIHHCRFDYRGAVFDVDPDYQGTEEWYELVAKSKPPKDQPWYHVLVDGSQHTTYVAERHLELDTSQEPIEHPLIPHYFDGYDKGRYTRMMN